MRVGVLPVSAMDGQRVGQLLPFGQPLRKPRSQLPALVLAQLLGKRELDLAVELPVGPLVLVRRLPIRARVIFRPLRHIPALAMFQFLPVLLIAARALDVIGLGAGRLPTGAGTHADFQMIDGHGYPLLIILSTKRFSKRNAYSALSLCSRLTGFDSKANTI